MYEIVDYQGSGETINSQGNIVVLGDQEALKNAINLWICSFRGERLYNPHQGGIVTQHLFSPISNERAEQMQAAISTGLTHSFYPSIKTHWCSVIPDYDRNTYWIEVKGYCSALQVNIHNYIGVKPQV